MLPLGVELRKDRRRLPGIPWEIGPRVSCIRFATQGQTTDVSILTDDELTELNHRAFDQEHAFAQAIARTFLEFETARKGGSSKRVLELMSDLVELVTEYIGEDVDHPEGPRWENPRTALDGLVHDMLNVPMFATVLAIREPMSSIQVHDTAEYRRWLGDKSTPLAVPDYVKTELERLQTVFERCQQRRSPRFENFPLGLAAETWLMSTAHDPIVRELDEDVMREAVATAGTADFPEVARNLPLFLLPDGHLFFNADDEDAAAVINRGIQDEGVEAQILQLHEADRRSATFMDWIHGDVPGMNVVLPAGDNERGLDWAEGVLAAFERVRSGMSSTMPAGQVRRRIVVQVSEILPDSLLTEQEQAEILKPRDPGDSEWYKAGVARGLLEMEALRLGVPADNSYVGLARQLFINLPYLDGFAMTAHGPVIKNPHTTLDQLFVDVLQDPVIAALSTLSHHSHEFSPGELASYLMAAPGTRPRNCRVEAIKAMRDTDVAYPRALQREPAARFAHIPLGAAVEAGLRRSTRSIIQTPADERQALAQFAQTPHPPEVVAQRLSNGNLAIVNGRYTTITGDSELDHLLGQLLTDAVQDRLIAHHREARRSETPWQWYFGEHRDMQPAFDIKARFTDVEMSTTHDPAATKAVWGQQGVEPSGLEGLA